MTPLRQYTQGFAFPAQGYPSRFGTGMQHLQPPQNNFGRSIFSNKSNTSDSLEEENIVKRENTTVSDTLSLNSPTSSLEHK